MDLLKLLGYIPSLIFDDGHGDDTAGKRSPDGTRENWYNKAVTFKLGEKAKAMGFNVFYTAPEDGDVALQVRTDRANAEFAKLKKKYPKADPKKLAILVSNHYNALRGIWDQTKGGVETYFYPGSVAGEALAKAIQKYLIQGTKQVNRGAKSQNLHMIRESAMPAVLVEGGFMDVRVEAELMLKDSFQDEVATEELKGICEYLGVPYEEIKSEGSETQKERIAKLEKELLAANKKAKDYEAKYNKLRDDIKRNNRR